MAHMGGAGLCEFSSSVPACCKASKFLRVSGNGLGYSGNEGREYRDLSLNPLCGKYIKIFWTTST